MRSLSLSLSFSQRHAGRAVPFKEREKEREKDRRKRERERETAALEKRRRGAGVENEIEALSLSSSSYYAAFTSHNSFFAARRFPLFLTLLSSPFPAPCSALSSPRSRRAVCASRPCPPFPGALRRVSRSFGRRASRFSLLFSRRPTSLFSDRTRSLRGQSKPFYRPFRVFRRV